MRKNNKGFTLIELIIAIALMLSLTILVIVGFTKVSDSKKEEADLLTEKQIETAAEQYFSSNYFYVDYMKKDSKAKVFVNLAKLVQEDYLNVTTKTSAEKKYDTCDIVYASYENTGVTFNYIQFQDIFKDSSKQIFGFTGSDSDYINYLKSLGLDKTEKKCTAEVFTASDVIVSIQLDTDYLASINKNLSPVQSGAINWYNDTVPLLITVSNKDNIENPKNKIKSVDVLINSLSTSKSELKESTYYKKVYRVMVTNDNMNLVSVSAVTEGGQSGTATSTYYLDTTAPTLQIVAYKTSNTSIGNSIPDITNISNSDKITNNTWVNASSTKKNIYLNINVNDSLSGVGSSSLTCTRISTEGADATKNSNDSKTYKKLYFLKNDKIVTYECEGFDLVGNSSGKQRFTIKKDVVNPSINLLGYYGDSNTIGQITFANLNSKIKTLTSYSSGNWTNQAVALKVERGDNFSGIKSHSCTGLDSTFTEWNRVHDTLEGTFNFSCSIEDNAGNTNSTTFVVKRDITNPVLSINGYVGTNEKIGTITNNNLDSVINELTSYDSSWTNKSIVLRSGASDSLSGLDSISCIDPRPNTYEFSGWRRVMNTSEGQFTFNCTAYDNAGNQKTTSITVKRDITKPTLSLTLSGYKTESGWNSVNSINYEAEAKDSLSGMSSMVSYWNKYGLTTTKANNDTYSWNNTSKSYYGGGSSVIPVTNGSTSKTNSNNLTGEGHRKIRYIVCDRASNCNSAAKSIKIDRTPPKVLRANSGAILCKRPSEPGNNAHGYSIEGQDNLSGTTISLVEYYSSWDCGDTNDFHWADSSASTSVAEDGKKIFTVLAGCSNNPSPGARFALVDAAGNKYKSGSNYYREVTHSQSSYSTSDVKKCSSSVWWNESPNR